MANKTFQGKSMKLGGGGRFAKGVAKIQKEGLSKEAAGAIMASAGRKKLGTAKMASLSAKGRKKNAY